MHLVAEANPIKQGLKHFYSPCHLHYGRHVAEANPIKQGLKLYYCPVNLTKIYIVAEANPIKQGLKRNFSRLFRLRLTSCRG